MTFSPLKSLLVSTDKHLHLFWCTALVLTCVIDISQGLAQTLDIPAIIRDFSSAHPDFENGVGTDEGIVEFQLGADGLPVYAGDPTTSTTSGVENFNTWYRDTPGVNTTHMIMLPFVEGPRGTFTYSNDAFFPINDLGFGNEGNSNNFHFTTEVHLFFTYQGGEVFSFSGDDDLFVFMNGRLALDLGGVHPPLTGEVILDDVADVLGLQLGQSYPLDLFHAERHQVDSNFRLSTTINLKLIPEQMRDDQESRPDAFMMDQEPSDQGPPLDEPDVSLRDRGGVDDDFDGSMSVIDYALGRDLTMNMSADSALGGADDESGEYARSSVPPSGCSSREVHHSSMIWIMWLLMSSLLWRRSVARS